MHVANDIGQFVSLIFLRWLPPSTASARLRQSSVEPSGPAGSGYGSDKLRDDVSRQVQRQRINAVRWKRMAPISHPVHRDDNFVNLAGEAGCLGTITNTFGDWCLVIESNISSFVG